MKRAITLAWCSSLLVWLAALDVHAQQVGGSVVQRGTVDNDLYLAGGQVDVRATVDGDLVAAGGRVAVGDVVTGDVLAAGGTVTVTGQAKDDVRVAGFQVLIEADVTGDVTAMGGTVTIARDAAIGGRAWLSGGEIDVEGRIAQSLRAAGRHVRLGGEVGGDVNLAAGEIEILPTARVAGKLIYESPEEARIAPGAQIAGGVERKPTTWSAAGRRMTRAIIWAVLLFAVGGLLLAGVVLAALLPRFTAASARTIRTDPWKSLAVGFAVFVAVPAAAFALMATVVGAMVGVALLAAYAVSALAAVVVGATWVGALGTRLFRREPSAGRVVLSALLGVIVLVILQIIPVLGALFFAVVVLLGMGGWAVHGYRAYAAGHP